jgi:uncharacterized protein with ParB-like and HNH nuclease domain
MKDLSHILKECSVKDIYYVNSGTVTYYKIPIYQRNYAWERDEISALIKDIYDSMVIDKPIYYIIKAIYSHKSTNWEYKHINHKKKFVFYLRLR